MPRLKSRLPWLLVMSVVALLLIVGYAESFKPPTYQPDVLKSATFDDPVDHGEWDYVWFAGDAGKMMGRRGRQVYIIGAKVNQLKEAGKFDCLQDAKVVRTLASSSGLWLLAESKTREPFAINLRTKKQIDFVIPGLTVPGSPGSGS